MQVLKIINRMVIIHWDYLEVNILVDFEDPTLLEVNVCELYG